MSLFFQADAANYYRGAPSYLPSEPESDFMADQPEFSLREPATSPSLNFCAEWNPEFPYNGNHCCRKLASVRKKKARVSCFSKRPRKDYCDEMTVQQRNYTELAHTGKLPDVLALIEQERGRNGDQAYCTVNNGFLAHGRRLIPSEKNRIRLNNSDRCTEFGTDGMIGVIEWLGRKVAEEYSDPKYSGVRLVVGDIAAPRGGCLAGISGRRGHSSHTNGNDADVAFIYARPGAASPEHFHTTFEPAQNWWFAKQILKNPYACVKVVFLDRKHIKKMGKAAIKAGDAELWVKYGRFFRHAPGHRNHFHIRVGDMPGEPGCATGLDPELETNEEFDIAEGGDPFVIPTSADEDDAAE